MLSFQTYYRQCLAEHEVAPSLKPADVQLVNISQPTANTSIANSTSPASLNSSISLAQVSSSNDSGVDPDEVCTKPWSYIPPHVLPIVWRVIYWTSQSLTW